MIPRWLKLSFIEVFKKFETCIWSLYTPKLGFMLDISKCESYQKPQKVVQAITSEEEKEM